MFRSSSALSECDQFSSEWCPDGERKARGKLDVADTLDAAIGRPGGSIPCGQEFRRDQHLLQGEPHAVFRTALGALRRAASKGAKSSVYRPPIGLAGEFGENLFRQPVLGAAEDGKRKSSRGSVFRRALQSYGRPRRCAGGFVIAVSLAPNNASG